MDCLIKPLRCWISPASKGHYPLGNRPYLSVKGWSRIFFWIGVLLYLLTSSAQGASVSLEYTYDALGRLVEVKENSEIKTKYSYDPAGNRTEKIDTVGVSQPPAMSLSVSPSLITAGESTTLSWSSQHADHCIGDGGRTIDPNGSVTFSPPSTRTLTLSCHGEGGSTSKTVTVEVIQPPSMTLSFSPSTINAGDPTTLSWSSQNTDHCIGNAGKTIEPSGSLTFSPSESRTITVSCHGEGGSTSKTRTITVQ